MKKKIIILISVLFISFVMRMPVFAHPGNTDEYGCHTCWTNCEKWGLSYGEYHCHNNKTGKITVKTSSNKTSTSFSSNSEVNAILAILVSGVVVYLIFKSGSKN